MARPFFRCYGDVLIAGGIVVLILVQLSVLQASLWLLAIPCTVALGGGVAVRRRHPLVCLAAVLVGLIGLSYVLGQFDGWIQLLDYSLVAFIWFVLFSVGAHTTTKQLKIVVILCSLSVLAKPLLQRVVFPDNDLTMTTADYAGMTLSTTAFLVALPLGLGVGLRLYRTRKAEAAQAQRMLARQEAAREALLESERARIARELHDVVSHALAITLFQARGGRRVQTSDPAAALAAFDAIERTNEQALGDMRRMLNVLRDTSADSDSPTTSTPTLRQLRELVQVVSTLGLTVDLDVRGDLTAIPPGVDLSAYRIVQESLTNVIKHAGTDHAEVSVDAGRNEVTVTILDDGPGPTGPADGYGLLGIRERVAVLGGFLQTQRRQPTGFTVSATLPYGPAP